MTPLPEEPHAVMAYVDWKEWVEARLTAIDREMIANCKAVDMRFAAEDKALQARLEATAMALALAERMQEARWESANEWRGSSADQLNALKSILAGTVTPAQHDAVLTRIDKMESWRDQLDGKANQSAVIWVGALSLGGFILSLITFVIERMSHP